MCNEAHLNSRQDLDFYDLLFFTANQFCLPYWGWWCLGTHNTYINTYIHTNTKTITCKNTCRSVPMSLGGATPFFYRATYRLMFNGHKWLIRLSAISCKVSIKGKYLYKLSITVCKSQCAACQIHIWPTIYWGVKNCDHLYIISVCCLNDIIENLFGGAELFRNIFCRAWYGLLHLSSGGYKPSLCKTHSYPFPWCNRTMHTNYATKPCAMCMANSHVMTPLAVQSIKECLPSGHCMRLQIVKQAYYRNWRTEPSLNIVKKIVDICAQICSVSDVVHILISYSQL